MRSIWCKIRVDIYGNDPVPEGLLKFSGVRTIVWKDKYSYDAVQTREIDWGTNEGYDYPDEMAKLCRRAISRLKRVHEAIYTATAGTTPGSRHLELVVNLQATKTTSKLCALLRKTVPESFFPNGKRPRLGPRTRSCVQHAPLLIYSSVRENGASGNAVVFGMGGMFGRIDGGYMNHLGSLEESLTRLTLDWCDHMDDDNMQLHMYTNLKELRMFVCVADKTSESEYKERLSRQLEALVNLRELHIGQSWFEYTEFFTFHPELPDLPRLTRLVLNEYVCFEAFAQLTHLAMLRELSINLGEYGWCAEPQDLVHSLATISALRSVSIHNWHVEQPQDVSQLTQLTELKLIGCSGLVKALLPAAPMPNIISIALTEALKDWREIYLHRTDEEYEFAHILLRNASTLFPNAQVMHLGTTSYYLRYPPFSAVITQFNGPVKRCLAASPHLRYLQYDVLAVCDFLGANLAPPIESVHVVMGEDAYVYDDESDYYDFVNDDSDSDGDDDTAIACTGGANVGGGSEAKEVRVWERIVKLNSRMDVEERSDLYMVEICYTLA